MVQFKFNPFTKRLDMVGVTTVTPGTLTALVGDTGGAVFPDGMGDIFVIGGTGIVVNGFPVTNTLVINGTVNQFTWNNENANFVANTGNGYFCTFAGVLTVTLPPAPNFGDSFIVTEVGSGTIKLQCNAGDTIQVFDQLSSSGGTVTSSKIGDTLELVCQQVGVGNAWIAIAPTGNWTVA